jgi:hypothetical protein
VFIRKFGIHLQDYTLSRLRRRLFGSHVEMWACASSYRRVLGCVPQGQEAQCVQLSLSVAPVV